MKKEFLRFYFVVEDFNPNIWTDVNTFIGFIEKYSPEKPDINLPNLSNIKIYTESSINREFKSVQTTILKENYGNIVNISSIKSAAKNLNNYLFIDYIIIITLHDNKKDFKDYLPFFVLLDTYKNISLGIKLSHELDSDTKDDLLFSFGQVFSEYKNRTRLFNGKEIFPYLTFFINKNSEYPIGNFPTQQDLPLLVLRKFSPIIEINHSSFSDLFQISLYEFFEVNSSYQLRDFKFLNGFIEKYDVRNSRQLNVRNLLIQRVIDLLTKLEFREDQLNIIFKHLFNRSLISSYFFCLALDRYLRNSSGTNDTTTKKYKRAIKSIEHTGEVKKLYSLLFYTKQFSEGLKEIAENTLYHTSSVKKGYMYFVFRRKDQLIEIFNKSSDDWFQENNLRNCYLNDINSDFYLEAYIADSSDIGIFQKFSNDYKGEKKDLEKLKFVDFFVGEYSNFPEESHITLRYLAHLGLKSFSKLILGAKGYFEVMSNNTSFKDNLITFDSYKNYTAKDSISQYSYKAIETNYLNGTFYDIILPITDKLLDQEISSIHFLEQKSFSHYAIDLLKNPEIYNSFYFCPEFPPYQFGLFDYDKLREYITSVGEYVYSSFSNSKKKFIVIDYRILINASKSISNVIKIISFLQLKNPLEYIVLVQRKMEFRVIYVR